MTIDLRVACIKSLRASQLQIKRRINKQVNKNRENRFSPVREQSEHNNELNFVFDLYGGQTRHILGTSNQACAKLGSYSYIYSKNIDVQLFCRTRKRQRETA